MKRLLIAAALACLPGATMATDLYAGGSWPALAADQLAQKAGDSLTVLIYENAVASNTSQATARRNSRLSGRITATPSLDEAGQLDLGSSFEGGGQVGRADKLAAQISVVVIEVLPNGDLRVEGQQTLNVDGAGVRIKLKGRVRRVDIASNNTVLSSRLADVWIDYKGKGYAPESTRPGVVMRVFRLLGII